MLFFSGWHDWCGFVNKTCPSSLPQGSVAKGGRTYFAKRLCENTRETYRTPTHTHTHIYTQAQTCMHTHFAQRTLKSRDKLFSAVLTSCSCPDTSFIWKPGLFLSINHLLRCGRAPEGPAPDKTHIADLIVAMQPHSPEKKRKDGRLFFHATALLPKL